MIGLEMDVISEVVNVRRLSRCASVGAFIAPAHATGSVRRFLRLSSRANRAAIRLTPLPLTRPRAPVCRERSGRSPRRARRLGRRASERAAVRCSGLLGGALYAACLAQHH
jgi:hypothetical protein